MFQLSGLINKHFFSKKMSNNRNSRSYNTSPLPTKEIFLSFLEPSPRPDTSPFTTHSTRTQSPKLITKNNKQNRISPIPMPSKINSKLELTQKSNVMLLERNRVLSREKEKLQKQISKDSKNPKDAFKAQALALTKESYLRRLEKKSEHKLSEFDEKVSEIRKILNWINEQSLETEIKFIKTGITELLAKFKGFEIELEANSACLLRNYERKIKALEEKIIEISNIPSNNSPDAISVLITKNADLSRIIFNLDGKIVEQYVRLI